MRKTPRTRYLWLGICALCCCLDYILERGGCDFLQNVSDRKGVRFMKCKRRRASRSLRTAGPFASRYRFGDRPGQNAVPESVCSAKQKQICQETGCESGRRIGRRARSSTEATPRRTANSTG